MPEWDWIPFDQSASSSFAKGDIFLPPIYIYVSQSNPQSQRTLSSLASTVLLFSNTSSKWPMRVLPTWGSQSGVISPSMPPSSSKLTETCHSILHQLVWWTLQGATADSSTCKCYPRASISNLSITALWLTVLASASLSAVAQPLLLLLLSSALRPHNDALCISYVEISFFTVIGEFLPHDPKKDGETNEINPIPALSQYIYHSHCLHFLSVFSLKTQDSFWCKKCGNILFFWWET